jgi:ligand-binding sensor domain-containing protein
MLIRCFILYLALFVVPLAHAQQFAFEKIGVRNGLPSTEVYNMFQDKYGYVWIFTEYGIVKYNGTSFVQVLTCR